MLVKGATDGNITRSDVDLQSHSSEMFIKVQNFL